MPQKDSSSDCAYAEAIKRINYVQQNQKPSLDLRGLPLKSLPHELVTLSHLEEILLGEYENKDEAKEKSDNSRNQSSVSVADEEDRQEEEEEQNPEGIGDISRFRLHSHHILISKVSGEEIEEITDITPLSALENLRRITMIGCGYFEDLWPIRNLKKIEYLKLRQCPGLLSLEPIHYFTNLRHLDISFCMGVTSILPLSYLKKLKHLNLGFCIGIRSLDPLRKLTSLRYLDLTICGNGLRMSEIRSLLESLEDLRAIGTGVDDIPLEVLANDSETNVIEKVRAYFHDLEKGSATDNELKAFVLGNSGVGKTKLTGRILGESYDEIPEGSTHGIQIHNHEIQCKQFGNDIRLNLWDFGGQEIYHGTHALFMKGAAVHLVLWSEDCENVEEFAELGFPMRNHRLAYWFDYLRQEANFTLSQKAEMSNPVILIQSKCDKKIAERHPPYLPNRQEFPYLYILHVSSKESRGLSALDEALKEAVAELFRRSPRPLLPESWAKVRSTIRAMQAEKDSHRVLTFQEFSKLCPPDVSDPMVLLMTLHEMGVVFYRPNLFDDHIIVDQSWALDAVYTVSTRNKLFRQHLKRTEGRFVREDLERFFWSELGEPEQETLLGFMEQCGTCFKVSEPHSDATEYVAPDFLTGWGEQHEQRFRWQLETAPTAAVSVTFAVLHDGIARGLLSKIGQRAASRGHYWRYGCHFFDGRTASEAMIQVNEHSIEILAWRGNATALIDTLIAMIIKEPFGHPPTVEWHTRNGSQSQKYGVKSSQDQVNSLRPLHPRKIFVSYSHQERSMRFITELCEFLRTNGWDVVVDFAKIGAGDSIREYCHGVRECPFFLCIIADDYLRKPWCLYELVNFFESCRCDFSEFRSRIAAVAEAGQIDDPMLIAEHQRFCVETYSKYLDDGSSLDRWTELQYRQISRWSNNISNLLATLADELGAIGLDELGSSKYAKILERLERKYERSTSGEDMASRCLPET